MKTLTSTIRGNKRLLNKMGSAIRKLNSMPKKFVDVKEKVNRDSEFTAMICPVTQMLNRMGLCKYFDQLSPTTLEHTGIILIEIDQMLALNDNYSTRTNNKILSDFSEIIFKICSRSDIIARWSDKEFVVLCPDSSTQTTANIANKIKWATQKNNWHKGLKLTCSAGVSQVNVAELTDLITRTKKYLNKAQKNAGNKVSIDPSRINVSDLTVAKLNTKHTTTCPITGALNNDGLSKYFNDISTEALNRVSVIFIEIDNLETLSQLNESKSSDEILQYFSTVIHSNQRNGDIFSRWSDSEYLVICPSTSIYHAANIANELKLAIQNKKWGKDISMTCRTEVYDKEWNDLQPNNLESVLSDGHDLSTSVHDDQEKRLDKTKPSPCVQSTICPITNVLNRQGLNLLLSDKTQSTLNTLSVIFIEVDGFDAISQKPGHIISNTQSKRLTYEITKASRANDKLARWSDNEYLLICPNTTLEYALDVAEGIRLSLNNMPSENDISINCHTEVYDNNCNDLTSGSSKKHYKENINNDISAA